MCKCANRPLTHLRIHYISALFMIDLTAEELKELEEQLAELRHEDALRRERERIMKQLEKETE